jgi:hypothetical protein
MKAYWYLNLFIFAQTLLPSSSFASETTLHETLVYQAPNGLQMASLKAGVSTEAGKADANGFSKIVITVDAKDASHTLPANTPLTIKGIEIGKTMDILKFNFVDESDKSLESFYGYINAKDLNPASIPERALEKTLAGAKQFSEKSFDIYLQHFHFRKTDLFSGYETFSINTNLGDGLKTQPRLYLVFEKDNLTAVIHLHDFKSSKAKGAAQKIKRDYTLTWFATKTSGQVKIMKTFAEIKSQ